MCHSTLLLQPFIPANSPLTISSFTSRPHPTGYQQLLFMEPTKFTHQPELSLIDVHKRKEEVGGSAAESEDNVMSKSVRAPTDPVLTQPGLGTTSTTITTITQTGGDWSSSLFDACGDKTTCILGALVPCCLDLSLAHQFGECLCLPLLPGSTFAMRVGIRERYKIQVSGAKTNDKRDEAPDEDSDLSCGHNSPMFLKTQQEEDKETFEEDGRTSLVDPRGIATFRHNSGLTFVSLDMERCTALALRIKQLTRGYKHSL
ncbi:PLAC8-like protein 1 [Takifugu flavidus]|uniref:PLAC8-like protein 1 n=1 Tax=Takifugu flavidus TaxID=433684 RepID=A0A5C6P6B3_9TELE|nr:PLAC8-like protein 1 [Takifugu flavidus]